MRQVSYLQILPPPRPPGPLLEPSLPKHLLERAKYILRVDVNALAVHSREAAEWVPFEAAAKAPLTGTGCSCFSCCSGSAQNQ